MSDSRHIVDEIKSKIRLSELIGEHVRLRRDGSGVRAMGLCPFHNEKSPSFSVNDDRGFYYCFGCGAKGDALTFLQDHVGLSFREALQQLADRTGVELPQQRGPEDRAAQQRARSAREAYQEVMGFARDLYVQTLWETQAGAPGRAYLEERGIDRETAERFQLGMAPDSWDTLVREARARRIPSSWLERAGLAKARQGRAGGDEQDAGSSRADGGHYDLFRNRVMFPILDVSGRVLAFSGRSLDPNDRAKYINSPETRFYVKGEQLYGLHAARAGIRQGGSAVLVEGNFDVVALHARGITRAVAPLGTALTPQQVQLLKRFAERVVLAFDADRAGRAAARRAFEVLLDERLLDVRYVRLPDGQDPDDVVRDGGAAAFEELEASARQMLDVCVDDALAPTMQDRSPIVVRGALDLAASWIRRVDDRLVRQQASEELARRLGVSGAAVALALRDQPAQRAPAAAPAAPVALQRVQLTRHEQALVHLLGARPDRLGTIRRRQLWGVLPTEPLRVFLQAASEAWRTDGSASWPSLVDSLADRALADAIGAAESGAELLVVDSDEAFTTLCDELVTAWVTSECKSLNRLVEQAQRDGDMDEALRWLTEIMRLQGFLPEAQG